MLVFKYVIFAAFSILVNLLFQYFSFQIYLGSGSLYVAMFFGTLAGLIIKYVLDKRFIFYHIPKNNTDNVEKFMLYSLMGVFTTVIFWGAEIAFDMLYVDSNAKYIGAIVGLTIGYIIKYFLDKRYVFIYKERRML